MEALLAAMLLAIAVIALCGVSNHAMVQVVQNEDDEIAWMVLDKEMTRIAQVGIDDFIEAGVTEGVNSDFEKEYRWEVETSSGIEFDYLYTVAMTVTWKTDKRQKMVRASTYLNGQK